MAGLKRTTLPRELDVPEKAVTVRAEVYGDAAYGAAEVLYLFEEAGLGVFTKVQQPTSRGGRFSLAKFAINIEGQKVTCPAAITVPLKVRADDSRYARFGANCTDCLLREQCTVSKAGRSVNVHARFELLHRHRNEQLNPDWSAAYRATRPKVERKLAHLVRRKHGGRHARMRGVERVAHDFDLLAAATNLARLAQLGLQRIGGEWAIA